MPPSEMRGTPVPSSARAASSTAVICAMPAPVTTRGDAPARRPRGPPPTARGGVGPSPDQPTPPGPHRLAATLHVVAAASPPRRDAHPAERVFACVRVLPPLLDVLDGDEPLQAPL